MPMSFREKSQWIVLLTVALVYGSYFARMLPAHGPDVAASDVARFAVAVVALVVLQVIGQALLAVADRREAARGRQHDERDTRIDLHASRIALHVLAVGVFAALSTALAVRGNFAFMHVLFGAWVLSHLAQVATRLVLYRRGL